MMICSATSSLCKCASKPLILTVSSERVMISSTAFSVWGNGGKCSRSLFPCSDFCRISSSSLIGAGSGKFGPSKALATPDGPSAIVPDTVGFHSNPSQDVLEVWQSAEAVCFDVDSTVCVDEGIDELADFCGAGEAVAAWTEKAMGGMVPFEVALASRLDLFKPSASTVRTFLASKSPRLSPGIVDLVSKLQNRGTDVYLVSGGFRQMIEPAATLLKVPKEMIYANTLLFKEDGEFAGFDAEEPTSRSGGKAAVIEKIKQECGYKKLVMIGDGATDLEARRPGGAEIFICYGGVVVRPKVVEGADWFVTSFADLLKLA